MVAIARSFVVPMRWRSTSTSRPSGSACATSTIVRMIEAGKLPARMVGTHRRLTLRDVLAHREASARRRGEALDDMLFAGGKLNIKLLGGARDIASGSPIQ